MFFSFGFALVTLNTWTLQNTAATLVSVLLHLKAPIIPTSLFSLSFTFSCPSLIPFSLTQFLQRAVATDLRFHRQLVGRWQLGQVVEGVREGRVAAVVSHAPSQNAATTNAAATGTLSTA